jgi:hypothetical protein
MARYAKIFDSLWDGSMRGLTDPLLVFINLLTHSDEFGVVDRHWRAISDETGLDETRIINAISFLEQPDPESRTPDCEGRRIVRLDSHRTWGWKIVNHLKYRQLCTKTQNAERQAKHRKNNDEITCGHKLPVGVDVDDVVSKFEWFWKAYPNKVGKQVATASWFKVASRGVIPFEKIMDTVEKFKTSTKWREENGKYIPHPATWLNQQRWTDELPTVRKQGSCI